MQLRVVHDETMRVSDALQSFVHGLAVDVDPARGSGGQEVPESHRREKTVTGGGASPLLRGLRHLHVDLFHLLDDPGTFSVSHVLTGLPETQVLRWERHKENKDVGKSEASVSTLCGTLVTSNHGWRHLYHTSVVHYQLFPPSLLTHTHTHHASLPLNSFSR